MQTYSENSDVVKTELLSNITNNIDKTEGYFVNDIISAVSPKFSSLLANLDGIVSNVFPQTAMDSWLDRVAFNYSIVRKTGVKAKTTVTFTGADKTLIQAGSIIQTDDEILQYTVDQNATITGTTITANVTATEVGEKYNVPTNTITKLFSQINGVTSIANPTQATGGVNVESNTDLRTRLLEKIQTSPANGNKADYLKWAKEINGVEDVNVIPLWNGPGTVKIICSGENGAILDSNIISAVENYICPNDALGEGKAPIGASVTVTTTIPRIINIAIYNLLSDNLEATKTNIKVALANYLTTITSGGTIKINKVEALVTNTIGVNDFSHIRLNKDIANIELSSEEKAYLGTFTFADIDAEEIASSITFIQDFKTLDNVIVSHGIWNKIEAKIYI